METTPEPDLLLCISPDNRMMHIGPASEVLRHVAVSAAAGGSPAQPSATARTAPKRMPVTAHQPSTAAPLEVYDIAGRRIPPDRLAELAQPGAPSQPTAGRDTVLARRLPGGFDDPEHFPPAGSSHRESRRTLLRRINESLDFAQAYLTEHPQAGYQGPGIPPATEVPRPTGTYAEVLQALASQLAPLDPNVQSNRGNWFHNLWHAANGTS